MRCSVFIATSLDGCIARADGALDWLPGADPAAEGFDGTPDGADHDGPDSGYDAFMADVDVIVMGRATCETVLGFGIGWPYPRPVVVLTSRPLPPLPDGADVRAARGDVQDVVRGLETEGFTHAYVDGGDVIQQFLRADLVDDMTITVAPVLLGDGIRLFGELPADRWFEPGEPRRLGDMVQTTWTRRRSHGPAASGEVGVPDQHGSG